MKRSQAIAEIAFLGIQPAAQTEGETESSGFTMRPATPMNIGLITAGWIKNALEEAVPHLAEDDEVQPADFDLIAAALTKFRDGALGAIMIPQVLEQQAAAFRAKFEKLDALRHM